MNAQKSFNYQQEIDGLKDLFGFDFVALALVQPVEHRFAMKWEYVIGNQSTRYRRIVMQTGKGVGGRCLQIRKTATGRRCRRDARLDDLFNYPIVIAEGLKSFGAIPLLSTIVSKVCYWPRIVVKIR